MRRYRGSYVFYSSELLREARLAERVGDHAGAIRAYRHYLALRFDPEPELKPEVDRVRERLARLEAPVP